MPRKRFVFKKKSSSASLAAKQQCCVVCYSSFYAFPVTQTKWESALTKVFYKALNIPPFQTGGEEDGDEDVLILPYCPDCHSKISVMFNLYSQLEQLQNQYACVRNEIAFLVVETIGKNCRNGPMDFIRQQIFDRWQEFYHEESSREDFREFFGLDALVANSQMELQDIYDSMVEESKLKENTKAENESFMDDELENDKSGDSDYNENSGMEHSYNGVGLSSNRRSKKRVATLNKSYEDEELSVGENHVDGFGKGKLARRSASGLKMPRLIPMNPSSKVHSPLVSVVNESPGKRRRGRPSRNALSQAAGIPSQQFYGNSTADYEPTEDPLAINSSDQLVDMKPSLKSLQKQALSHLKSKNYDSTNIQSPVQTPYPKLQPMVRYPTRTSGRTRSSYLPTENNQNSLAVNNLDSSVNATENGPVNASTPGIYTCTLCPKFYTATSRLLRHESLCHPSLKAFHCDTCKKGFSSRLTYRRHMSNVHGETIDKIMQCPICAKTFLKEYSLNVHMESHKQQKLKAKGKPRGRSVAIKRAKEQESLLKNGNVSNGSASSTPVKKNQLWSPEKSRSELSSDSIDSDDLTCRICHKVFPYRTLLNMHFITHARKNYKCEICNVVFTSYTELKFHSDEVHRSKPLPCTVCGKEFSGAESLQRHFRIHDLKQELIEPIEPEEPDEMMMGCPSTEMPILPN